MYRKKNRQGKWKLFYQLIKSIRDDNVGNAKDIISAITSKKGGRSFLKDNLLTFLKATNNKNIASLLLDEKAYDSQMLYLGLKSAIVAGKKEIAKLLIEKQADLNLQNISGYTALMLAIENGANEIAILLIEAQADLNLQSSYGSTALMLAIENRANEIAKLLIDKHAVLNLQDRDGFTALMFAIENGANEIAILLIEAQADLNLQNSDGVTALMLAIKNRENENEIAKLLIAKQTDLNLQNFSGYTALMLAIVRVKNEIAKLLIEAQADLNLQNISGFTALMFAIVLRENEIAKLLIDKHADLNLQNSDGVTALMLAIENGANEIASLLIEKTEDFNALFNSRNSPMKLALRSQNNHAYDLFKEKVTEYNTKHICEFLSKSSYKIFGITYIAKLILDFLHLQELVRFTQLCKNSHSDDNMGQIGDRFISGMQLQDVPDDGNCFYHALYHQLQHVHSDILDDIPEGTSGADFLRLQIQENNFNDREWADDQDFRTVVNRFPDIVLAVIDTRNPNAGFTYYYIDDQGNTITNPGDPDLIIPEDRLILRIAATGNHFMSVVEPYSSEQETLTFIPPGDDHITALLVLGGVNFLSSALSDF